MPGSNTALAAGWAGCGSTPCGRVLSACPGPHCAGLVTGHGSYPHHKHAKRLFYNLKSCSCCNYSLGRGGGSHLYSSSPEEPRYFRMVLSLTAAAGGVKVVQLQWKTVLMLSSWAGNAAWRWICGRVVLQIWGTLTMVSSMQIICSQTQNKWGRGQISFCKKYKELLFSRRRLIDKPDVPG